MGILRGRKKKAGCQIKAKGGVHEIKYFQMLVYKVSKSKRFFKFDFCFVVRNLHDFVTGCPVAMATFVTSSP